MFLGGGGAPPYPGVHVHNSSNFYWVCKKLRGTIILCSTKTYRRLHFVYVSAFWFYFIFPDFVANTPYSIQANRTLYRYLFEKGIVGSDFLGLTCISGWIIIFTFVVLTFFALPQVRQWNWEWFYWSHKLRLLFWAALIIHVDSYCKFFVSPFLWYCIEKAFRDVNIFRWFRETAINRIDIHPQNVIRITLIFEIIHNGYYYCGVWEHYIIIKEYFFQPSWKIIIT